jgi:hypothetical protein
MPRVEHDSTLYNKIKDTELIVVSNFTFKT